MAKIKFIILLFFFLQLKNAVDGAAYIIPPQEKPHKYDGQIGCYVPDVDKVVAYNSSYYPPGICAVYQCADNGYTSFYSCGVVGVPEGCKLTPGNRRLVYPKCCDNIKCSNDNGPPAEDPLPDPHCIEAPSIEEPPLAEPVDRVPV